MKTIIPIIMSLLIVSSAVRLADAAERVTSFDAHVVLKETGSILVHETIRIVSDGGSYEQDEVYMRGVYRSFYIRQQGQFAIEHLMDFRVIDAQMDGKAVEFRVKGYKYDKTVYLGPKKLILSPGEHEFGLTYTMDRVVRFMPEFDELFWWVFGKSAAGWAETIGGISITVELPPGVSGIMHELHTYKEIGRGNILKYTYMPTPGKEYFLVKVKLPKGAVRPPDQSMNFKYFFRDMGTYIPVIIGLIIFFLYYFIAWFLVGKDPARGIIVPAYTPPADISPAVMRCLVNMGYDHKAFTAALVNLIVKGHVKLVKDEKDNFILHRISNVKTELFPDEQALRDALFTSFWKQEDIQSVPLNASYIFFAYRRHCRFIKKSLRKTYYKKNLRYLIPGIIIALLSCKMNTDVVDVRSGFIATVWTLAGWTAICIFFSRILVKKRAFDTKKPARLLYAIFLAPLLIYAAGVIIGHTTEIINIMMVMFTIPLFIMITVFVLFYYLLPAPTIAGRKLLDKIEGFAMFLKTAETERLKAMYPEDELPDIVERIFPFAVALDEEKWWAERFAEDIRAELTLPLAGMIFGMFRKK